MLSSQEAEKIRAVLAHYELKKAASIEALKIVQQHRGWVSDESLRDVAEMLEMSPTDLDSVATFYNLIFRKPVGRHVILICDSVSCWVMGYASILDCLQQKLGIGYGETTADGRFTLLPHVCLGACHLAPVMMIDDVLYGELDDQKIDQLLSSFE